MTKKTTRAAQQAALEATYQAYVERAQQQQPNEALMEHIKRRDSLHIEAPTQWRLGSLAWNWSLAAWIALLCAAALMAYQLRASIMPWLQIGKDPENKQKPAQLLQPNKRKRKHTILPVPPKQTSTHTPPPPAANQVAAATLRNDPRPAITPVRPKPKSAQVMARQPSYSTPCPLKPGRLPLKIATLSLPEQLNPLLATGWQEHRITELLFDRLVGIDEQGKPIPALAIRWRYHAKTRTMHFMLRKGVTWHDGRPFSAKDVAFTLQSAANMQRTQIDRKLKRLIASIKVLNPYRLQVKLRFHPKRMLSYFQRKIIPKHLFSSYAKKHPNAPMHKTLPFSTKPIGTGPFLLQRWIGKKLVFQRNPKYWRKGFPCLNRIIVQAVHNGILLQTLMKYNAYDITMDLSQKYAKTLKPPKFRAHPLQGTRSWILGINHQHTALGNKLVRQAISMVINRSQYQKRYGSQVHRTSPALAALQPKSSPDIASSKRLLAQAGWKSETDLFSLRLVVSNRMRSHRSLVHHIRTALGKLGIKVIVQWRQQPEWNETVIQKRLFDLTLLAWEQRPGETFGTRIHSQGKLNFFNYKSKAMDQLVDDLTAATTNTQINNARIAIKRHYLQELPFIPLWRERYQAVFGPKVKAYWLHPTRFFLWPHRWSK